MMHTFDAASMKHRVGLGILLGERIGDDPMMPQE
jgi:hypothetical protein